MRVSTVSAEEIPKARIRPASQGYDDYDCPGCGDTLKIPKPPKPTQSIKIVEVPANEDAAAQWKEIAYGALAMLVRAKRESQEAQETEPKVITKSPRYVPRRVCFKCGGELESNQNYSVRPAKRCTNCQQYAPDIAKACLWCKHTEFDEVSEEELTNLGIPLPGASTQ